MPTMATSDDDLFKRSFYVTILEKDGRTTGHRVSPSLPGSTEKEALTQAKEIAPSQQTTSQSAFEQLFETLCEDMDLYRRFIPFAMSVAPSLSRFMAESKISDLVKSKGVRLESVSTEDEAVYEVDVRCFAQFASIRDEISAAADGAKRLPNIMLLGLISSYDAFLGRLLRLILATHPQIVFTQDKQVALNDVLRFASIEDARRSIIDDQVEDVLRKSHKEHFDWMEKHFSIALRSGLDIWPKFIEVCQRRHLITHTGGVVTSQYVKACKEAKFPVQDSVIGTVLDVDSRYFGASVRAVYEVSCKLCYVMWRKFDKKSVESADTCYNQLCYRLISDKHYKLADALLTFSANIPYKIAERTRRQMIVNLANAKRLQGRKKEASEILNKEDWTASEGNFRICVAAVLEDLDKVVELMDLLGPAVMSANDYRNWPIFRGMETSEKFLAAFERTFSEPFVLASYSSEESQTSATGDVPSSPDNLVMAEPSTLH